MKPWTGLVAAILGGLAALAVATLVVAGCNATGGRVADGGTQEPFILVGYVCNFVIAPFLGAWVGLFVWWLKKGDPPP